MIPKSFWAALVAAAVVVWVGRRRARHDARLHMDHANCHPALAKGVANIKLDEFHVPRVFQSSFFQLALLVLGSRLRVPTKPTITEQLTLPGGENVFLDWFYPPSSGEQVLGKGTPIAIYLPGITGRASEALQFVNRCHERGYIAIVFHRRGHAQRLKLAEFNIFGNSRDLKLAIDSIQMEMPESPIALVGSSAGTAVMVRYLGEYSHLGQVACAVGLSPGYDVEHVWHRIKGTVLDRYLVGRLKEFFLHDNLAVLREKNSSAVDVLLVAETVHDFALAASVFTRHDGEYSYPEWLEETCPLKVVLKIAVPTLCLNALDDPICLRGAVERIGHQLPYQNKHCALITTEFGSHCAHQDFSRGGWLPDNWGHTLALDFIHGVIN
ncbi:hypothetical protein BASA81_002663 [Batrachochytrium salamandrivorans]|nr:hypothetical protein BASA81_002663 [Batrachochytrium salamandrivorans]